jgi:hypothetical protein
MAGGLRSSMKNDTFIPRMVVSTFSHRSMVYSLLSHLTTLLLTRLYSINDTMINEYGAVAVMETARSNGSAQRKPSPISFCPSQIPQDLTPDRIWAARMRTTDYDLCTMLLQETILPTQETL